MFFFVKINERTDYFEEKHFIFEHYLKMNMIYFIAKVTLLQLPLLRFSF